MESSELHGQLLTAPTVAALCVFALGFWCALHWLCYAPPCGGKKLTVEPSGVDAEAGGAAAVAEAGGAASHDLGGLLCQRRKLVRYRVYCYFASVLGLGLLVRSFVEPLEGEVLVDLCCGFSWGHQVAFAVAAGHWIVNFLEDLRTHKFMGEGLSSDGLALFPLNLCCTPAGVMSFMHAVHHVSSAFAYFYALSSYRVGGMMVQGLMFEMPVVLMCRRDLAVSEDQPPAWLLDRGAVQRHWFGTYVAFALGRIPGTILFFWTLIPSTRPFEVFWEDVHMDLLARVVVYCLGAFFTALNLRLIGLFLSWHQTDLARAEAQGKGASGGASPGEQDVRQALESAVVGTAIGRAE